ncbi:MAG TPA: hypothetical protein VF815_12440 [Myxococcaceae bacterium]|jgi:hypothetical protein
MSSRTQVVFALGLLLLLSGGCQLTKAGDDVLYACEPEGRCASAQQVCSTQNLCLPRSQAIRILEPENTARVRGATRVEAVVDAAGVDPGSLVLTVSQQGQAPATVTLRRVEPGRYVAQWTPARGEGSYELRASAPDEGLESAPVTVLVDNDTPAFTVEVPAPGGPPSIGGLILRDPQAPTAWRRDERVTVTVTSDDPDLDAATVRLVVTGASASGDGRAEAPVAVQRVATCAKAYCGSVELDLAVPELSRFRGPFKLRVTGTDQSGNAGSGTGEVQVTRWKWELEADREIVTSLAIGARGLVYVGTRNASGGQVLGIRPDGTVEKRFGTETPYDALSIGHAGDAEVLFVSVGQTQSQPLPRLIAIRSSDGQLLGQCTASADSDRGTSRMALGSGPASDASLKDVAVIGFFKSTPAPGRVELLALRLDEPAGACLAQGPLAESSFNALISDGRRFYYSVGDTRAVTAEVAGLQEQPVGQCNPGAARLTLIGKELIASRFIDGSGTRIDPTTGACQAFAPGGPAGTQRISSMAIDSQGRLYYGKLGSNGRSFLARSPMEPGGGAAVDRELAVPLLLTPMLGQGGWVYTTTDDGKLQAWTRDLALGWEAQPVQSFRGITGLDCARDGAGQPLPRPGVLYMAHGPRLRAVIVESRGLDTDAPWPKGQHDSHNSGNSSVDLRQFACP